MKQNNFVLALAISIVYTLVKFIEMKFILKEKKPLKVLFRDAVIVYLSVLAGIFVVEQVIPIKGNLVQKVGAFTNTPDF